jgi:hypothetical protein
MELPPLVALQTLQQRMNAETATGWNEYETHRASVMRLVRQAVREGAQPSACVLGAGNCNDIDLREMAKLFSTVHLVDIDPDAVRRARSRSEEIAQQLTVHAPYDLTGLARPKDSVSADRTTGDSVLSAISRLPELDVPKSSCGVVLSASVLSQLIGTVSLTVGRAATDFATLLTAMRRAHLQLMFELLEPGGRGILIGELASSEMCDELLRAQTTELPKLTRRLLETQNFFTGMNPFAIAANDLATAVGNGFVCEVEIHTPWIWQLNSSRRYLAYGITFQRDQL